MLTFTRLCQLVAALPALAVAQDVFAHVVMGVTTSYTVDKWTSDIKLAQGKGIDAFVLNIATPYEGNTATQVSNAFTAANSLAGQLSSDFKLFFSFDYLGGTAGPWSSGDIVNILNTYGKNGAHFQVDGKPMVSTFEGTRDEDINSWPGIRSSVQGNIGDIYFVPDWDSKGPNGFDINLVDGVFSWNMWPDGPVDKNTDNDLAWQSFANSGGKSYMMGISPWFYTDLPQFGKAWVWRGDNMWYDRWQQALDVKPRFIEIVTWNDYGESHYISPTDEASIVDGAQRYVDDMPHEGWLQTLPYQIAAYKNASPTVASGSEKIVYWYRKSPAAAGSTDATGNNCPSSVNAGGYQTCYSPSQILEDEVFAVVLASQSGTATINIGDSSSSYNVNAGINSISKPFNGATGTVSVSMGSISGSGVEITSSPSDGVANFNAWVGCAGSCS